MFESIADFFKSGNHGVGTKSAVLILIIIILFFADKYTEWSYYYINEKRIEQIDKIDKILSNTKTDSLNRIGILKIQKDIIFHENIVIRFKKLLVNSFNSIIDFQSKREKLESKEKFVKISLVNHFISSSIGFFVISIIFSIYFIFFDKTPRVNTSTTSMVIALFFMMAVAAFFLSLLLAFIPQLQPTPMLNYLINAFISLLVTGFIVYKIGVIYNKKNKK